MITPTSPPSAGPAPRRGPKLLFLAVLFGVLLNYPLLAVFDHDGRVAGVPVLYLYVLLMWAALVALTGWLVRKRGGAGEGADGAPHPPAPSPRERGSPAAMQQQ